MQVDVQLVAITIFQPFMGFRNPRVSIYHPLRGSLRVSHLKGWMRGWLKAKTPGGKALRQQSLKRAALYGMSHGA